MTDGFGANHRGELGGQLRTDHDDGSASIDQRSRFARSNIAAADHDAGAAAHVDKYGQVTHPVGFILL
jgi:hypothetical protein